MDSDGFREFVIIPHSIIWGPWSRCALLKWGLLTCPCQIVFASFLCTDSSFFSESLYGLVIPQHNCSKVVWPPVWWLVSLLWYFPKIAAQKLKGQLEVLGLSLQSPKLVNKAIGVHSRFKGRRVPFLDGKTTWAYRGGRNEGVSSHWQFHWEFSGGPTLMNVVYRSGIWQKERANSKDIRLGHVVIFVILCNCFLLFSFFLSSILLDGTGWITGQLL